MWVLLVAAVTRTDIVTALPLLICVLHCVQIFISLGYLFISFITLAWNFGLLMCGLTRATASDSGCLQNILCRNVLGLSGNQGDLTVASSHYDLLLCSEILVSDRRLSELFVPGFSRPVLLCQDGIPRAREMAAYVRMDMGHFV